MTIDNAALRDRIACHSLWISDPRTSLAFYRDKLGLHLLGEALEAGMPSRYLLSFEPLARWADGRDFARCSSTVLELLHQPQVPARYARTDADPARDGYWKTGISLPDVDRARRRLLHAGIEVGEAAQFLDIGYLCHLADADGYTIELLQHRFEHSQTAQAIDSGHVLGSAPHFGQVTLRVRDATASLEFYRDCLGMRLLSRQIVAAYGFTLYFLAYTDEVLPVDDIDAVENREWLWQRPYTLLELQHFHEAQQFRAARASGFERLGLATGAGGSPLYDYARKAATSPGFDPYLRTPYFDLADPDGYCIRVHTQSA